MMSSIRGTGSMECTVRLLRLDACELDHLAPLLGLFGDQLAEVAGRTGERCSALVGEARLVLRISKRGVDRLVEHLDDLRRRVPRRADAGHGARLVAGDELA